MRFRRVLACTSFVACAAALVLAACASGPRAGGQGKRTILLGESDDARVGEEESSAVAAQMGLFPDPELEAYVSQIGRRLLRGVPRRSFQYHFSVVDQFEPNAFALPGGYIYVSRGLLALANSEDELACVIGHEITHAAQRHAAMQQALARQGGPLTMPWVRAAQTASYGRDMERDADRGGQILAAAAGYDPMGLSRFLTALEQTERLRLGHPRQTSFLDTHPGSQERAAVNAVRSHELRWQRDPALGDTRNDYLRRIDGLPVGPRPEGGVFEGDRFLHADLDFQVSFPSGWRTSNSNLVVGAISPQRDAVVYLTADRPAGEPKEVAEAFVVETDRQLPVEVRESVPVKIGQIDAWRVRLEGRGLVASVTFFPYGGATWRVTSVSTSLAAKKYLGRMLNTARSFRPLTAGERNRIHGTRLHMVTARPGEDLSALSRRSGNAWDISTTAVYNGIFADHRFAGGELVKTALVEPYRPGPRPPR
jgi:predicted Zn-dependent protease